MESIKWAVSKDCFGGFINNYVSVYNTEDEAIASLEELRNQYMISIIQDHDLQDDLVVDKMINFDKQFKIVQIVR